MMTSLFWLSFALLWALVVVQGLAFLELLRQVAQLRKDVGPSLGALIVPGVVEVGAPLPPLAGVRASDGGKAAWSDYLLKESGVIVLLRSGCVSCHTLAAELSNFASSVKTDFFTVAVIEGRRDETVEFIRHTGLDASLVVIDEEGATAHRLGVSFSPGAVSVRDGSLYQAGIVNNVTQVHALLLADVDNNAGVKKLSATPAFFEAVQGR